ncbi:MAG: urea ABC transporter substrate-binding protein, partial [Mariprofundaceae bacterium]|nr:urea ABC transporter substrate-binding protein [Mariprofundaceae bacterium]
MAVLLVGCQKTDETPIKIGILHSLTGTMAISEQPVVDATLLAIEEINTEGGLLGRQLVPVISDGQSKPSVFAGEAERLIKDEGVAVIFGCWTSASRKMVKPIVEQYENLLFYPVQYEGMELSPHIVYTGEVPSQQIIPAISWVSTHLGKRLYLIGSDYIFPRTANWLIHKQAALLGMQIVGENHLPLGTTDFSQIVAEIARLKPDAVINTVNGDSNLAFFKAMFEAGLKAETTPVVSFSIGENELIGMPVEHVLGHYAAASYFQSIDTDENRAFIRAFKARFGQQ